MSTELTVKDVLALLRKRAQWCRANGESDMRNILNTIRGIKSDIAAGKTRDEIMADDDE